MATFSTMPFVQRLCYSLVSGALILITLYLGQHIIIPIAFACLFSIILIAPCDRMEKAGINRGLSATIALVVSILLAAIIFYLVSRQLLGFRAALPVFSAHLKTLIAQFDGWIQNRMHINDFSLTQYLDQLVSKNASNATALLGSTVSNLSGALVTLAMIPVYTFLLLLYRDLIVHFVVSSFDEKHSGNVRQVLEKTKKVINQYILGLFLEMAIVCVLYCTGFFILGVQFALLLGVLSALLNIIPYLGFFTAFIMTVLITLSTNSPATALGAAIVLITVHILDGNVLMPKIVGSKIKINALFTIMSVIVGDAVWGIPGMFLALPVVAILKILFDSTGHLPPWGLLVGDEIISSHKKQKT
jgi:predicted PurR-regulated permease PerM